jgi:hypothetical protein
MSVSELVSDRLNARVVVGTLGRQVGETLDDRIISLPVFREIQ